MRAGPDTQLAAKNTVYVGVDPVHRFCSAEGSLANSIGADRMSKLIGLPAIMEKSIRSVRDQCQCAVFQSEYHFGQHDIPTPDMPTMCTADNKDREILLPKDVRASCEIFNKHKHSIFSSEPFMRWIEEQFKHLAEHGVHDDEFFINRVVGAAPEEKKLNIWLQGEKDTGSLPASAIDAFQELLVERGIDFRFLISNDGIGSRDERMPEQREFIKTLAKDGCNGALVFDSADAIAESIAA